MLSGCKLRNHFITDRIVPTKNDLIFREQIEKAKNSLDLKKVSLILKAAYVMTKINNLDKETVDPLPYEDILVQPFELTIDVSVLGLKPIENLKEVQRKMRKKYGSTRIEEAEIIEDDEK